MHKRWLNSATITHFSQHTCLLTSSTTILLSSNDYSLWPMHTCFEIISIILILYKQICTILLSFNSNATFVPFGRWYILYLALFFSSSVRGFITWKDLVLCAPRVRTICIKDPVMIERCVKERFSSLVYLQEGIFCTKNQLTHLKKSYSSPILG